MRVRTAAAALFLVVVFVSAASAQTGSTTINVGAGGKVKTGIYSQCLGPTCTLAGSVGSELSLEAIPFQYFEFAGWSGACTGTNPGCKIAVAANGVVGATFRDIGPPKVNVSLAVSNGTISWTREPTDVCGYRCTAQLRQGVTYTFTAVPNGSDLRWVGWSGACTGTAMTCTKTIQGEMSITATFQRKTTGTFQ